MKRKISLFIFIYIVISYAGFVSDVFLPGLQSGIKILIAVSELLIIYLSLGTFKKGKFTFYQKLLLAFLLVSSVTYYLTDNNILTHLNGIRFPLVFLCSLIFIDELFNSEHRESFKIRFSKQLLVFAILQLPTSLYLMIVYGAGDRVGGTFGIGGGSGFVTQLLFLISLYYINEKGYDLHKKTYSTKEILPYLLLLIPTFLNETKITFLLLVVLFSLIVTTNGKMRFPVKKIALIIPFFIAGVIIYDNVQSDFEIQSFFSYDHIRNYFYDPSLTLTQKFDTNDPDNNIDVSRIGKIILLYDVAFDDHQKEYFGLGYGIMQGKNFLGGSALGESLEALWFGSQGLLFTSLIQGGIAFAIVLAVGMFSFVGTRIGELKNKRNFFILLCIIFGTMFIYNQAILEPFFSIPAAFFIVFAGHRDEGNISILPLTAEGI